MKGVPASGADDLLLLASAAGVVLAAPASPEPGASASG
jgi:hypothetical protein